MKRFITIWAAMGLLCSAFVLAPAAQAPTVEQATQKAMQAAPAGSVLIKTRQDAGRFEFDLTNEQRQEGYEIEVSASTGELLSFDSELWNDAGSRTITLTQQDAGKVVTAEIPSAEIVSTELKTDDGLSVYKVVFQAEGCFGDYHIHPQSGKALERDISIGTAPDSQKTRLLAPERITELALAQVPQGAIVDMDLEDEGNVYFYKVKVYKDGVIHKLGLDAVQGTLLWNTSYTGALRDVPAGPPSAPQGETLIGLDKAREIALAKAPGATVVKCELDEDDGRLQYEGELAKGGWEYEFEIDAKTGRILKWEEEYDD